MKQEVVIGQAITIVLGALAAIVSIRVANLRLTRLKVAIEIRKDLPEYLHEEWDAMICHRAELISANHFFPSWVQWTFGTVLLSEAALIIYLLPSVTYHLTLPFLLLTTLAFAAYMRRRIRIRMRFMRATPWAALREEGSDN